MDTVSMLVGIPLGLALGAVGGWRLGRVGEAAVGPRADAAADLYERIYHLAGHLDELAKGLTRTVVAYTSGRWAPSSRGSW